MAQWPGTSREMREECLAHGFFNRRDAQMLEFDNQKLSWESMTSGRFWRWRPSGVRWLPIRCSAKHILQRLSRPFGEPCMIWKGISSQQICTEAIKPDVYLGSGEVDVQKEIVATLLILPPRLSASHSIWFHLTPTVVGSLKIPPKRNAFKSKKQKSKYLRLLSGNQRPNFHWCLPNLFTNTITLDCLNELGSDPIATSKAKCTFCWRCGRALFVYGEEIGVLGIKATIKTIREPFSLWVWTWKKIPARDSGRIDEPVMTPPDATSWTPSGKFQKGRSHRAFTIINKSPYRLSGLQSLPLAIGDLDTTSDYTQKQLMAW